MFFEYNTNLVPPYEVLIDTSFLNFAIRQKIDLFEGLMNCLYAKATPIITDCVMAELEKHSRRFSLALKLVKDPRVKRVICTHSGNYGDDCIVRRCTEHRIYIAATCDTDLRRRIRKIPGVPIMYVSNYKFRVERLPDASAISG
jgi:U3 small nucleolar RNA-associated protein 24